MKDTRLTSRKHWRIAGYRVYCIGTYFEALKYLVGLRVQHNVSDCLIKPVIK